MPRRGRRPNVEKALAPLKGFQRATAEYAFHRLYTADDYTRRFLVADEVGLGKTLVARGIIAKAIDHLWKKIDRIDVVYICSNHQIARQNVNRLQLSADEQFVTADRLTLLPTAIKDLRKNKVNFLAFTPGTSFDLKSSMGKREERVLLYWLVQEEKSWARSDAGPKNLFQGGIKRARDFRRELDDFHKYHSIDRSLAAAFKRRLREVGKDPGWGGKGLRKRYHALCDKFHRERKHIPPKQHSDRAELIGELRSLLAETCVQALEPDLVILDEFQRFKQILHGTDEAATLAQGLFNYTDAQAEVRLLLLSATPYKMYTLHHEEQEDHHHADFLDTVGFLDPSLNQDNRLKGLLEDYGHHLRLLGDGADSERLLRTKKRIESALRRVMTRTERVGATGESDGMLRTVEADPLELRPADVRSFVSLQGIGREVGQSHVVEYWKSAPYLLNFMDDYKLKSNVVERLNEPGSEEGEKLGELLAGATGALLDWRDVEAYRKLDPRNARLRGFMAWLQKARLWELLWLPPSMPYYELEGAFRHAASAGITKRLIFSTWKVVPKVLAGLVSYEVEQEVFDGTGALNTPEERKKRKPLLRFTFTRERLTGMPVLGLMYPSPSLARFGDPLEICRQLRATGIEPTLPDVLKEAKARIADPLDRLIRRHEEDGREDQAWYWAAPILLDRRFHRTRTLSWFADPRLPAIWAGENEDEDDESRWADHVEHAQSLLTGKLQLGRPPQDLLDVIALRAVAGPATCALRALTRPWDIRNEVSEVSARNSAACIAWHFRSLFNQPEAMALIGAGETQEDPYWKRVLRYCAEGQLQAVMDEYLHVLRDMEGVAEVSKSDRHRAYKILGEAVGHAVSLRTGSPHVDEIRRDDDNGHHEITLRRMRNHFAIRFGAQEMDDGKSGAREEQVREAFNSPFWPFVLTTTSVGQEGLDFHAYCHAVVHWNLPTNPVDLEQREGRVHRYKGHAVRKNVASKFAAEVLDVGGQDAWRSLFARASETVGNRDKGMSPYWVYPTPGGAFIERHAPALPLSRDTRHFAALRRSLAIYRMVFGQPRQDELLAYLARRLSQEELQQLTADLQIDLRPPASGCPRDLAEDSRSRQGET